MKELEDLEKKLRIVKNVLSGHSHKELNSDTIYRIMEEMDSSFIYACNHGVKPEQLEPLNRRYIRIIYHYLCKSASEE